MTVKFTVKIEDIEGEKPICAFSEDVSGGDGLVCGYGHDVYDALRDLISEIEEREIFRGDDE